MSRRGIFAVMEDLDYNNIIVNDVGDDFEDEKVLKDTQHGLEVTSDEIGEITGTIDNTLNTVDTLMAIGDKLDQSAIPGIGINEISIKPTMIAVEALFRDLGIANPVLPSLESFANTNTSAAATQRLKVSIENKVEAAIEGIKEVLKKIGEKVASLAGKFKNAIKNVFKPQAKKLKERLAKVSGDKKGEDFYNLSLYKFFAKPGDEKATVKHILDVMKFVSTEGSYYDEKKFNDLHIAGTEIVVGRSNNTIYNEGNTYILESIWRHKDAKDKGNLECGSKKQINDVLDEVLRFKENEFDENHWTNKYDESKMKMDDINKAYAIFEASIKVPGRAIEYCRKAIERIEKANKEVKE